MSDCWGLSTTSFFLGFALLFELQGWVSLFKRLSYRAALVGQPEAFLLAAAALAFERHRLNPLKIFIGLQPDHRSCWAASDTGRPAVDPTTEVTLYRQCFPNTCLWICCLLSAEEFSRPFQNQRFFLFWMDHKDIVVRTV